MNTSSIVSFTSFVNLGIFKKTSPFEKENSFLSSNNTNGDVFVKKSDTENMTEENERHIVVTYDDVYVFETPKKNKNTKSKNIFGL